MLADVAISSTSLWVTLLVLLTWQQGRGLRGYGRAGERGRDGWQGEGLDGGRSHWHGEKGHVVLCVGGAGISGVALIGQFWGHWQPRGGDETVVQADWCEV